MDTEIGSANTPLKCVVVGDGAVGKTCILIVYAKDEFPEEYIPTVFDNYLTKVYVDGVERNIGLWDTAGQEDYDRLRPLSYPDTHTFLLVFSVVNRDSFINIEEKWIKEINHHQPNAKKILVGNKVDLLEDKNTLKSLQQKEQLPVSIEEGNALAQKLGCVQYIQCSAKTKHNLKKIFDLAIRSVLFPEKFEKNQDKKEKKQSGGCSIL